MHKSINSAIQWYASEAEVQMWMRMFPGKDSLERLSDLHADMAKTIFDLESPKEVTPEQRHQAMAVAFGILYGNKNNP